MLLDSFMPVYDASRAERLIVDAEPSVVYASALDIRFAGAGRLDELEESGTWILLGHEPPREIAFGAVRRFGGGPQGWEPVDVFEFADFDYPGFVQIACALSVASYGVGTMVTYEVRTWATDEAVRADLPPEWGPDLPDAARSMRSALATISERALRASEMPFRARARR